MPPSVVKTIEDLIYWEYAKLISGSAVGDRKNRAFTMYTFRQLKDKKRHPSDLITEFHLFSDEYNNKCAYCGSEDNLEWEHIIPQSRAKDKVAEELVGKEGNQVKACRNCNASKNDKDPYEWYLERYGKEGKYEIPRLVWGKYLKLMYELHEKEETLNNVCSDTMDINFVLKKL